ncbi:YccF domain-containing protein [Streptomyces sp. NPDC005122]
MGVIREGAAIVKLLSLILNILWLVFCGIWMALAYTVAALICFVLIITIPFGVASLRIAGFVLWPFGRTTVPKPDAGAGSLIGNVIWIIVAGWWLAIGHLVTSIPLFLSIIGIPFGWANLKMIPISLMPLGREVVSTDEEFGGR